MKFKHIPHPHVKDRKPPKTHAEHRGSGLLDRLGLRITLVVGTMYCALAFALLAFISLPAAFHSGDPIIIVAWVAQTFLQLVLLPIIIVGQNLAARASDERADGTFKDAEAILHECLELQAHLQEQDKILSGSQCKCTCVPVKHG